MNMALLLSTSLLVCAAPEAASLGWPGEYGDLKVLNNFVTELSSVALEDAGEATHAFPNPRDGWVFFSVSCEARVVLDDKAEPLEWRRNPDTGAFEAMRLLSEGTHKLEVAATASGRLDVRAVPEIAFCYYPSGRHIKAYGPYDWAYVGRHVLPHVNTLITRDTVPPDEFEQWLREGRQWISNASLPGLGSKEPPTVDGVYNVWAENRGVTGPGFSGMIVDEFGGASAGHYQAWGDAVRRLDDTAGFKGRTFYAWCGNLFSQEQGLAFSRLLADLGYRFSWERYLREDATVERARERLVRDLQAPFAAWRKAMPGVERHTVVCLGYLCAPPETLNLNPAVNYHVYLDMQFNFLATDPTFWGLYGIMEYMAAYADEESIRWAHKLFRHYCIEGKRTPLIEDPYALPHLQNPDFADGLDGWRVEAAEKGSIAVEKMKGFSWLEGRYPPTPEGDQFCWMKRSAKGPNRVRQTIQALEPGRVYSVKLISADLQHLETEQALTLSVHVAGAQRLEHYCFQQPYPSCYSHVVEPYNREHPAHFNFHRVVFRAQDETAELVISDWRTRHEPGGPFDQEIAFNFVEVQPFLEP